MMECLSSHSTRNNACIAESDSFCVFYFLLLQGLARLLGAGVQRGETRQFIGTTEAEGMLDINLRSPVSGENEPLPGSSKALFMLANSNYCNLQASSE